MRPAILGLALSALLAAGCNALLGVEELKDSADAGPIKHDELANTKADAGTLRDAAAAPGQAGSAGTPGMSVSQAGSAAGRAGTTAPTTAAAGGGAGVPMAGHNEQAGQAGQAGQAALGGGGSVAIAGAGAGLGGTAGSGGNAGNAGTQAAEGSPVRGTVIDALRHVVPNVNVRIGAQSTTTDASGQFAIDNVAATYTVTLTIQTSIRNVPATTAWQVQGLTRRDPTLQVDRGLPDRNGSLSIQATNVSFPLSATQKLVMGWSGADGNFTYNITAAQITYLGPRWIGPAMTQGTAHALLFNYADPQSLPTAYLAHDAHPVALSASMTSDVSFDLGGTKPTAATVAGSVAGSASNRRINYAFLRFADNAALPLLEDGQGGATFSYLVPSIPNAVITVVAEDKINTGGYAAAFADNVAPGQADVALTIPNLPTLLAPGTDKANVDATTLFQWNGDAHVFVFCARANNQESLCVVTSQQQTQLPISPLSALTPAANTAFSWRVQTHGDYASVDAASGPTGFLSAFAGEVIGGPARGSGSYTESPARGFTTAP